MFCGEFVHPLDDKSRVVFPARLRDVLSGERLAEGFFLTRGFEGALLMLPRQEWDVMSKRVSALPANRAEARILSTSSSGRSFLSSDCSTNFAFSIPIFSNAVQISLDRQGRMLIPESHRQLGGIKKEVVFAGFGKYIELWSRERYDEYLKDAAGSYDYAVGSSLGVLIGTLMRAVVPWPGVP